LDTNLLANPYFCANRLRDEEDSFLPCGSPRAPRKKLPQLMLLAICSCRNNQEINLPPVVMLIRGAAARFPQGFGKLTEMRPSQRGQ